MKLVIDINCGEKTCSPEKDVFCSYFGTYRFGTIPVCRLFPSDNESFTELQVEQSGVQRCQACRDATKKEE